MKAALVRKSRVGMYLGRTPVGTEQLGHKYYELSNHLGNVLAVVTDNINIDTAEVRATVVSVSDYYPFGLSMEGRTFRADSYRYGFNGKERDLSFGSIPVYDYGFRIYNPRVGKFLSVDPLTKEYPFYSPYQYAGNAPTVFIDLDGMEPYRSEVFWKRETQLENRLGNPRNEQYFSHSGLDGNGYFSDRVIAKKVMSENGSKFYWLNKTDHIWQEFDGGNVRPEDVKRVAVTAIAVTGAGIGGAVLIESGGGYLIQQAVKRYGVKNFRDFAANFTMDALNQFAVKGDINEVDWANALVSGIIGKEHTHLKNLLATSFDLSINDGLETALDKEPDEFAVELGIRTVADYLFGKYVNDDKSPGEKIIKDYIKKALIVLC